MPETTRNKGNGENYETEYTTGKTVADAHAEAGSAGVHCVCTGGAADHWHHLVLIHRGKEPAASSEQPGTEQPADDANIADHYQINEQSSALLPETADAGDAYQSETLFIGDSNTVRLYANGLISLQQFCAKEGIGTSAALNEGIVTFKKDSSRYTIAEAVAKMKPRRVVIMLGTNDTGMAVEDFISNYKQLVQAIQTSYPTPTSS